MVEDTGRTRRRGCGREVPITHSLSHLHCYASHSGLHQTSCQSACFLEYFARQTQLKICRETTELKPQLSADETIEHAKRAFALKKYEQAVDHYATALELKYAPQFVSHLIIRVRLTVQRDQGQRAGRGFPRNRRPIPFLWQSFARERDNPEFCVGKEPAGR